MFFADVVVKFVSYLDRWQVSIERADHDELLSIFDIAQTRYRTRAAGGTYMRCTLVVYHQPRTRNHQMSFNMIARSMRCPLAEPASV